MKNIIRIILIIIASIMLSSYMFPNGNKGKYKVNDSTSVNINVTAKNIGPYKLEANEKFMEALESTIAINKLKTTILQKLELNSKDTKVNTTNQELVLKEYGYSKEFIVKRIRNDTTIKFISILLIIIPIIILIRMMKKYKFKEDWKPLLIKGFFIFVVLAISQLYLYYILSI
jgi:hypothetical protein